MGFYLTYLFRETDVILQPDWMDRRVRIKLEMSKLDIFRPGSIDLILTKMARGDEDDFNDIRFLIHQESIGLDQLKAAFIRARIPEIPEIKELFNRSRNLMTGLFLNLR